MAAIFGNRLPFLPRGWQAGIVLVTGAVLAGSAAAASEGEASGVIVREIRIDRSPIFDEEDRERFGWLPLSIVNDLHIDTRVGVIERELLFAEGQPLDPEHLQESERKLRGLGIFTDVVVEAEPAPGDSVDVVVRTQEVWSTSIDVGYESFEDERFWSLSLSERNLLGTARRVDFQLDSGVDRSSWAVGLGDPQLFDGTWNGSVSWRDADDGNAINWRLSRPYVSLTDRAAFDLFFSDRTTSPRYYIADGAYVRPKGEFTDIGIEFGHRLGATASRVWRGAAGYRLHGQELTAEGSLAIETPRGTLDQRYELPRDVPENESWRTVYLGISQRTRIYEELRFVRGMGKVEDIAFGPEFDLRLGWTTRALGSTDSGLWLDMRSSWFGRSGRGWLHEVSVSSRGLVTGDGGRDLRVVADLQGYHRLLEGLTFATGFRGGAISQADRHQVFSLGLESGLRAARFREFNGDRLLRANFELRAVYTPGLLDTFVPGVTLFADTGVAWFEEERDFRPEELRGAYGVGLRLGFVRAADDLPVRLDLAWPALYDLDRSSPVISVGTGQVF